MTMAMTGLDAEDQQRLLDGYDPEIRDRQRLLDGYDLEIRDRAKLVRFARALSRAAGALTGSPILVKLDRVSSTGDSYEQVRFGNEIEIGINLPLSVAADHPEFIRSTLGLYYHALTHVWFTPRNVPGLCEQKIFNLLEDQRIESFAVALFPALAGYFRTAFAHMVAHGGVPPEDCWLLAAGRKYLDPVVVAAAKKVYRYRQHAEKIEKVVASYKRLHTKDLTADRINGHIQRLLPLIGWDHTPPQISHHPVMKPSGSGDSPSNKEMADDALQLIEQEDADSFEQTGGIAPDGTGANDVGGAGEDDDPDGMADQDPSVAGDGPDGTNDLDSTGPDARPADQGKQGPDSPVDELDHEIDGSAPPDGPGSSTGQPGAVTGGGSQTEQTGQDDQDDGDPGGVGPEAGDRRGGSGASATGRHGPTDPALIDQLLDAAEEAYRAETTAAGADSSQVAEDIRLFRQAMQGDARIAPDNEHAVPVTPDMDEAAHGFAQKMAQFLTPDVDPGWLRHEPTGKINPTRFVMGDIEDYDTMFDTWEPGHTDAFNVTAAVMVDRSPSMGSVLQPSSMIMQACRAAWTIRRGLELQDAQVRTQFWCDGDDFVYIYGDDPVGRDCKVVQTAGGTAPAPALADIEIWLESRPDDENRILFILTDGHWADRILSAPIVARLRAQGVLVVLVGFGMLPDMVAGAEADVVAEVNTGDDFVQLAADVMEALYRRIVMTFERR